MLISIACLIVICIVIFVAMGKYLTREGTDTMSEIGTLYMSQMCRQVQEKFDAVSFDRILSSPDKQVAGGYDAEGNSLLFLVVDAEYPMSDGRTSSTMVAGIPMKYMEQALRLESEGLLMYSVIIRRDGSFVVRGNEFGDDYFSRVGKNYEELDGLINQLSTERQQMILGACSVLLLFLMVMFALYYRMSQRHLRELDKAEREAVRAN